MPFPTRATSSDHLHWSRETAYAHTTGFLELSTHVLRFTPAWGAEETGLDANQIISFARRQARTGVRRSRRQARPAGGQLTIAIALRNGAEPPRLNELARSPGASPRIAGRG